MERVARGSAMAGTRHQTYEREVRDLRCFEFETKVVIDVHRICCPDCGVKPEKVDQLPSQAPHSRRLAKTKSDRSADTWSVGWLHGGKRHSGIVSNLETGEPLWFGKDDSEHRN